MLVADTCRFSTNYLAKQASYGSDIQANSRTEKKSSR